MREEDGFDMFRRTFGFGPWKKIQGKKEEAHMG